MQTDFIKNIIGAATDPKVDANTADEKLIELFANEKDVTAFEKIFNRYVNKIYSIAIGITRDRNSAEAEEVLQEVFLRFIKKNRYL